MSPIKGLTDRPRLTRLGKIHLGIKVEGEKSSYPKATDYFVCPKEVQAVHGEKPQELKIAFPTEDPDQWASVFYRAYSSYRGLVCKGTGEYATRLVDLDKVVDSKTGELPLDKHPKYWPVAHRDTKRTKYFEIICPPDTCQEYGRKQCRPIMNLQFLLIDVPGVGVWQIDTSSWNSIHNVLDNIRLIKMLAGRLSMIPLTLALVPREVQPEGVKKTVRVLQLSAPYKVSDLIKYAALPAGQALLPEPDLDVPEDLVPEDVIEGEVIETPGPATSPGQPASPGPATPSPATSLGQPALPGLAPATPASPGQGARPAPGAGASALATPAQAGPPARPTPATRQALRDQIRALLLFGPAPSPRQMQQWWDRQNWGYALDEATLAGTGPLSEEVKAEHLEQFLADLESLQAAAKAAAAAAEAKKRATGG